MPAKYHKYKFNQKVVVFFFFLVVSSILWFLNALSKEYITYLTYPVKYVNLPKNKIIANELPESLKLKVQSFGFTIFKQKITNALLPLSIDVNNLPFSRSSRKDTSKYFILTATIRQELSNQIGEEVKIISIEPDSLIFQMERILARKVPVKANIKLNLSRQHQLSDKILLSPDSILVYGPFNIIDTLTYVYTNFQKTSLLNSNAEFVAELKPLPKSTFSTNLVKIAVPVEKFTECKIEIPVNVLNLPANLKIKTFPEKIIITYFVGFSNYSKIKPKDFKAIIDYNNINDTHSTNLRVKLIEFPQNVKIINYYPKNIDYIVEK